MLLWKQVTKQNTVMKTMQRRLNLIQKMTAASKIETQNFENGMFSNTITELQ